MLFTKDNAASYGRIGAIARWAPKPEPPPKPPIAINETDEIKAIELTRVRSRLDALDRLMSEAETDRQWDNLSRAYERVFRAWVHLAGIPGPGQRKPAPEPARRKVYTDAGPTPAPQTTTQSVQQHITQPSNPNQLPTNESH